MQFIMVPRALAQRAEAHCWLFDNRLHSRCNSTERSWLGQVYEQGLPKKRTMIAERKQRTWRLLVLQ